MSIARGNRCYVVRQQPPLSPPPILTHYILIIHVKPFQPLMALVGLLYAPRSRCLLLSAVDPIGTGGHGDPNRVPCLAKRAIYLSPSAALFISPTVLYHSPLVTLYRFLFAFTPFSFPPLWGAFYLLLLSWEWPRPKKQPHSGGPLYIVARTGH